MRIVKAAPLRDYIHNLHHLRYIGHICRSENTAMVKKVFFATPICRYYRSPWLKITELLGISEDQAKKLTQSKYEFAEQIRKRLGTTL